MSKFSNYLDELGNDAKQYADLRIDELKLKATKGLSTALSQVCAMFLIIAVLVIVLGLLSLALLQLLNSIVGAPWGTFIVFAAFLVVLIVLLACRRTLFRGRFVKLFIDAFFDHE